MPSMDAHGGAVTQPAPEILTRTSAEHPVSYSPVLEWTKEPNSVSYQLEFFSSAVAGLDPREEDERALFRTSQIFSHTANLPLDEIRKGIPDSKPLWWRVRALDENGKAISPFSRLAVLYVDATLPRMSVPIPRPEPKGRGSDMIYPVYSWVQPYGTTSFDVELYQEDPEQVPDAAPVGKWTATYSEQYDDSPRFGEADYYWRVRVLDEKGNPGPWSEVASYRMKPRHWEIAVFGDSISHGGGHLSHGPRNMEYSWLSYLDFPAVNLSHSGDVTGTLADRLERDVLPFSPDYLLILCGTNDLRADDFTVEGAIANIERVKEKCLRYGIRPIFLTLPPINPGNIDRTFNEKSVSDWQQRFAAFNDYLRKQPHIDTAAAFAPYVEKNGDLPTWMGLDGLHEDIIGKQLIAARVNAELKEAKKAADEFLQSHIQRMESRKENMTDAESH